MTAAAITEVLEGPLLNDLAALFRAEWHDEPREDPLSAELMPIVNRMLLNDAARPFLDKMLQYFHATGKIPGIENITERLFVDATALVPSHPKDPITFCIAFYIMALAYASEPMSELYTVAGARDAYLVKLMFMISPGGNPQAVLKNELLDKFAHRMREYYKRHLPVWDLLALHLQEISQVFDWSQWEKLRWPMFLEHGTECLRVLVMRLQELFRDDIDYSPARVAWGSAVARGVERLRLQRLQPVVITTKRRRAVGDFGGGSAGAGSGAGFHGGRSRRPRRRLKRSRSRACADKALLGGRRGLTALVRRSRSRARLARSTRTTL
jgi:hypothetical protein